MRTKVRITGRYGTIVGAGARVCDNDRAEYREYDKRGKLLGMHTPTEGEIAGSVFHRALRKHIEWRFICAPTTGWGHTDKSIRVCRLREFSNYTRHIAQDYSVCSCQCNPGRKVGKNAI